jgi:hypothetical protein
VENNMSKTNKYGNIYEIKLPSGEYIYVCWIRQFSFGIFDYKSKNKITNCENLLPFGFKLFKACKETGIRKKDWVLNGHIDLEKENIEWPDLAQYRWWDRENCIEQSKITRDENDVTVSKEYYKELVEKGYIDGFFDNHKTFELWIDANFYKYPDIDIYPPNQQN